MTNHDDIKAILEGAEAPVTDKCCIYRVPFHIRKFNDDAYTPKVVSIGPFHHKSHPRLQNMERHKLLYCKAFLERTQTSLDSWIRYIEEVEPDFRRCYSDTLEFSKKELVDIILVDSGFIIELFCRIISGTWSRDDRFLATPLLFTNIVQDLCLLENQLPFFVLEGLFNLSFASTSSGISFLELTLFYFDNYNRSNLVFNNNTNIRHFTDLIRTFHLQHPLNRRPSRTDTYVKHFPSATELLEAGVSFKVNIHSKCLLDLRFSEGVLQIPQLEVEDSTEILLRNMIALELCHYPYESYITDYAKVLDLLINTSRDVDVLVRKNVLVNWQEDNASVANLFNGLLKNVIRGNDNSHYLTICQDLNAFCKNPWNNSKSTLRQDYCKSPWQTAATIAGIVLLILSLVQTICSVLQVIQQ